MDGKVFHILYALKTGGKYGKRCRRELIAHLEPMATKIRQFKGGNERWSERSL